MKKYTKPSYTVEQIETKDIVLASALQDAGEATVGNITGEKVIFSSLFTELL